MQNFIYSLIGYFIVLLMITGLFWGVKNWRMATIHAVDHSMEPEYDPGTYWVNLPPDTMREAELLRAFAYAKPGATETISVGWLVAKEGDRVDFGQKLTVNGSLSPAKIEVLLPSRKPFVVPRGCVLFIPTKPQPQDAMALRVVPLRSIRGQMR